VKKIMKVDEGEDGEAIYSVWQMADGTRRLGAGGH
jgi:hypothetical protein